MTMVKTHTQTRRKALSRDQLPFAKLANSCGSRRKQWGRISAAPLAPAPKFLPACLSYSNNLFSFAVQERCLGNPKYVVLL